MNGCNHKSEDQNCCCAGLALCDFEFLRTLGQGSFGKVFLVRKSSGLNQGRLFAMKVLKKSTLRRRDRMRAKNERDILATARHPFIVQLDSAFQTESRLYLILEYLSGGDLFSRLSREIKLSETDVKFYLAELVLALDYVHHLGVIYRDLKPENILLDSDGHVKLIDFGLSKERASQEGGRAFSFCGTIEYMAPEVITRRGHDSTADWWSMGVLMFEMLCGILPFQGENRRETMHQILSAKLRMPEFLSGEAQLLLRALFKRNPRNRLGYGPDSLAQFKNQEFFYSIHWDKLLDRSFPAPYIPDDTYGNSVGKNDVDSVHIGSAIEDISSLGSTGDENHDMFNGFCYNSPSTVLINDHSESLRDSLCLSTKKISITFNTKKSTKSVHFKSYAPGVSISTPRPRSLKKSKSSMRRGSDNSGEFFDKYELLDNFGGQEYTKWRQCTNKETRERRSVKILENKDSKYTEEITFLWRFRHLENVVSLLEVYESDNHVYFVSEPLLGGNLMARIRQSQGLNESLARTILETLSRTIYQVHRSKVYGIDLNPKQLMFADPTCAPNSIRICSFNRKNIAKRISFPQKENEASEKVSSGYTCDMWNLGILLSYLLTGYAPRKKRISGIESECYLRSENRKSALLTERLNSISEDAKGLLLQLLDRLPEKRPNISDVLAHPWIQKRTAYCHQKQNVELKLNEDKTDCDREKHTYSFFGDSVYRCTFPSVKIALNRKSTGPHN